MKRSSPAQSVAAPEGEETGLPWLPTWKGIYLVVILNFVLWIIFLVALTELFS